MSAKARSGRGRRPAPGGCVRRVAAAPNRWPLWAPWRMAYIGAPKPHGCIFCAVEKTADHRERLILACTATAVVMMNRFPYANGHLMVAPRRHTAEPGTMSTAEYQGLMETLRRSMALLQETLRPEGVNVGMNLGRAAGAGIADHLHWHIVPRWVGDVNFMPLIGDVRVIPEHLETIYDRLRPAFAGLDRFV